MNEVGCGYMEIDTSLEWQKKHEQAFVSSKYKQSTDSLAIIIIGACTERSLVLDVCLLHKFL